MCAGKRYSERCELGGTENTPAAFYAAGVLSYWKVLFAILKSTMAPNELIATRRGHEDLAFNPHGCTLLHAINFACTAPIVDGAPSVMVPALKTSAGIVSIVTMG